MTSETLTRTVSLKVRGKTAAVEFDKYSISNQTRIFKLGQTSQLGSLIVTWAGSPVVDRD